MKRMVQPKYLLKLFAPIKQKLKESYKAGCVIYNILRLFLIYSELL